MGYKIRGNRIYVTGTVDGTHYRLSTGKEATPANIAWIKKNHRDVLLKLIDKDKPKRSELFKDYAPRSMESNAYAIKPNTHSHYTALLDKHIIPYFKSYRLDEIKPSDVKAFQSKLLKTLTPQSVKNVRSVLSKILEDARMDEIIDKNPVSYTRPPKVVTEDDDMMPFTLEETGTLIKNAKGFFKHYLIVAFFTGMRSGELIALKWDDIDFNSGKIVVRRTKSEGIEGSPKTGKSRTIDMLDEVRAALSEQYKETGLRSEYVFITRKGKPFSRSASIQETYWKPLLKRCGIAYRVPYNTRHTFASLMLLHGEDILWVSKMLGHTNVSTTTKYYIKFVEEKGKKRAAFINGIIGENRTLSAHQKEQPAKHA